MNLHRNSFIFLLFFALGCNAYALSIRVPSLGARVIESDAIILGSFLQNESNDVMLVENMVFGKAVQSNAIKISFCQRPSFPSMPDGWKMSRGKRCLVMGKLDKGCIYLRHGMSSVLPIHNGTECLKDIDNCLDVVKKLLKYRQMLIERHISDDLIGVLLQDISSESGRVAVYAFLSEDVSCWTGRDGLRRDIGCVVGAQLLIHNAFDNDSVKFVSVGMPSIPLSLKLRYLRSASLNGSGNRVLSEKMLLSLLIMLGHSRDDLSASTIDACLRRCVVGDMRKAMRLLRSDSEIMRRNASEMLSMISGRPNPEKTNRDKVLYWSRILEEIRECERESHGHAVLPSVVKTDSIICTNVVKMADIQNIFSVIESCPKGVRFTVREGLGTYFLLLNGAQAKNIQGGESFEISPNGSVKMVNKDSMILLKSREDTVATKKDLWRFDVEFKFARKCNGVLEITLKRGVLCVRSENAGNVGMVVE